MSPCSPEKLQLELGPPACELCLPLTLTLRTSCQHPNRSQPLSNAFTGTFFAKIISMSINYKSSIFF